MKSRIEEVLSNDDSFFKEEDGLNTEFFVFDRLYLPGDAKKIIKRKYSLNEKFKLMKRIYNAAPESVVRPLQISELDGKKGYLLEYVKGGDIINQFYRFKNNDKLRRYVINQLDEAVSKIHEKGYVHGDLVGGNNIMLTYDGEIKLIDPLFIPNNFKYKYELSKLDNLSLKEFYDELKTY